MSETTEITATLENQNPEIEKLLTDLVRETEKFFGTYAYATGFLQGIVSQYFDRLPESAQQTLRLQVKNAIELYSEKKEN